MEIKIELKDYYTILNLHKALLEAKFHENPDNENVAPSPIIAELCNTLVEALEKMDGEKDKKDIGKWENWRMLKNQAFYKERALKNAVLNKRWGKMSKNEKIKTTINMLSPFKATEEEIESFIKEVDGYENLEANHSSEMSV